MSSNRACMRVRVRACVLCACMCGWCSGSLLTCRNHTTPDPQVSIGALHQQPPKDDKLRRGSAAHPDLNLDVDRDTTLFSCFQRFQVQSRSPMAHASFKEAVDKGTTLFVQWHH